MEFISYNLKSHYRCKCAEAAQRFFFFRGQAGGGYWTRELCGSALRRFSIQRCRRGRERRRDGCRGVKRSRGEEEEVKRAKQEHRRVLRPAERISEGTMDAFFGAASMAPLSFACFASRPFRLQVRREKEIFIGDLYRCWMFYHF